MFVCGTGLFVYKLTVTVQNQSGLNNTIYIPVRQPGEMGPKPIMAKIAKTERHLICVEFILVGRGLIHC